MNSKSNRFPFTPGQMSEADMGTTPDETNNSPDYATEEHAANTHHATTLKDKARMREAYAGQDEMPPFAPNGFGPIGGLFTDDVAAPNGHGVRAHSEDGSISALIGSLSEEDINTYVKPMICPSCQVQKEADDARLRALAEVDNARKRMAREKEEHIRYAAEGVLSDILPALDNLDLALQHAGSDPACKNFTVGVEMTKKLMLDSLKKHGLEAVGNTGEAFDPNLHEAVAMEDCPDIPDGHICKLLSCGYMLRDRLLRPARVVVCKHA